MKLDSIDREDVQGTLDFELKRIEGTDDRVHVRAQGTFALSGGCLASVR